MRTELAIAPLLLALALACEPAVRPPPVPERDARPSELDAGTTFMVPDAGRDGGPVPDGAAIEDAAIEDGAMPVRAPVIDGTIGEDEWAGAIESTAAVTPLPPYEGDRLTRVLAIRTAGRLYVAIEGTIEPTHALTMYVDADFQSPEGILFATGNELTDELGVLDRALSAELYDMLSGEMRPEYAWGTTMMPISLVGSSDVGGWREIASNPSAYVLIASSNNTACSATACETSIALGVGGIVGAGRNLAVFLRAVDGMGFLSNQTLPQETGGPEFVSRVLLIPDPATLDGGT